MLWVSDFIFADAAVVLFYAGPIQRQQITSILNTLLAPDALIGVQWYPIHMPLVASLVATLGTRVILTWFDTPLALPAGDFIPVFVIGALFGHIFVIILQAIVPSRSFSATGLPLRRIGVHVSH
jgi:H+/Cl- antiporter ClcA